MGKFIFLIVSNALQGVNCKEWAYEPVWIDFWLLAYIYHFSSKSA